MIFMDHMMPELDGVETTRIIRRLHPTYDNVPIIALTANAVDGAKEMFLSEGMNDFVAKPVEVREFVTKIRKWLPADKIIKGSARSITDEKGKNVAQIIVGDLDTDSARKLLGNDDLFWKILKEYYNAIPAKSVSIKELEQKEDWKSYTVEVHALKSASRQIGAQALSDMAADLEKAGNELNIDKIKKNTDQMLQKYVGYIDILKPFCEEEEEIVERDCIDNEHLNKLFDHMLEALENLDMDQMEEVIIEMNHYSYQGVQNEYFEQMKMAVGNIDVERCEEIVKKWSMELQK